MAEAAQAVRDLPRETMSLAQSVRIWLRNIKASAESGYNDALCGALSGYHPDTKPFFESLGFAFETSDSSRATRICWGGENYRDPRKEEGYTPYQAPEGFYINAI